MRPYHPFEGAWFWSQYPAVAYPTSGDTADLSQVMQQLDGRVDVADGEEFASQEPDHCPGKPPGSVCQTLVTRLPAKIDVYIEETDWGTRPKRSGGVVAMVRFFTRGQSVEFIEFATKGEYAAYVRRHRTAMADHGFRYHVLSEAPLRPTGVLAPFDELEGNPRYFMRNYPPLRIHNVNPPFPHYIRRDVERDWMRETAKQRWGKPSWDGIAPLMFGQAPVYAEFAPYGEMGRLRRLQRDFRERTCDLYWREGSEMAERIETLLNEGWNDDGRSKSDELLAFAASGRAKPLLRDPFLRMVYGYRSVHRGERNLDGIYLLRRNGKLFQIAYSCVFHATMRFGRGPGEAGVVAHIRLADIFGVGYDTTNLYCYASHARERVRLRSPVVEVWPGGLRGVHTVADVATILRPLDESVSYASVQYQIYFVRVRYCHEDEVELDLRYPGSGVLRGTLRPRGEYIVHVCSGVGA